MGEGRSLNITPLGDVVLIDLDDGVVTGEPVIHRIHQMTVFLIAICIGVYANAIRIIHTD